MHSSYGEGLETGHYLIPRQSFTRQELFRKLKTSGFHWENTHMKKSERLVSLLIILGFGFSLPIIFLEDNILSPIQEIEDGLNGFSHRVSD
jgi:hypothetical protein